MPEINDTRLQLILRVERTALAIRYTAYIAMSLIFFLGYVQGRISSFVIITLAVLTHNLFAHWVIITKRYDIFRTPLNFLVHTAEAVLIVEFTGVEESQLFVLYLFLLIGYTAYGRRFYRTVGVAFSLCLVYGFQILVEWYLVDIKMAIGVVLIKLLCIMICGVLVAAISEMIKETENRLAARARALAASEMALRAIFDNTADPIVVYDEDDRIIEINDSALAFLSIERDGVYKRRFTSFLFDDGTIPEKLAEVRSYGEYRGEQVIVLADGQERTVDFHVRSFERNNRHFMVAIMHDISKQKEIQQTAFQANLNLERANYELNQFRELKTGFLMTISQKLRSPMTAILGYVDMLLEEELGSISSEQRTVLQNCRRSVLRVFRFVDEALVVRRDATFPSADAPAERAGDEKDAVPEDAGTK